MSKNKVQIIYILLIGVLFISHEAKAEQPNYYFKQISLEQGLSQSRVQCIYRDLLGVIWIGTKWGLNSYDQSELKNYFQDHNQPNSLPDNFIRFITEGAPGNLCVGTNKGVAIYNRAENQFQQLLYNGKPFQGWSYIEMGDNILFGGDKTIYNYSKSSKSLSPIFEKIEGGDQKNFNRIFEWGDQLLVASSRRDGVWIFDLGRKSMYRYPNVKKRDIYTIFVDSQKRLWVSFYGKGVECYSQQGEKLHDLSTKNSGLNNDIIFDFLEKDNQLWMATDGGGINILNLESMSFSHLKHISDDEQSLPDNSIYCLYKDHMDNIWGGSIRGGLFAIKQAFVKIHKDVPLNNSHGISERTVTSIYEDTDTLLWIGTDGGGINSYNPTNKTFRHHTSTYGDKIASIANISQNELMLSCFNKGILIFNKKTSKTRPFLIINDSISKNEFSSGNLVNLYATKDNIYILGTKTYIYNKATKRTTILNAPKFDYQLTISLQAIHGDDTFLYLMGVKNLFRLDLKSVELTSLACLEEDQQAEFTSACIDDTGNFWIGSTFGLLYYNKAIGVIEKIPTNLFSNISSLAYDKKGRVWIGAQNMLFAYIIKEKSFVIMDESSGIPSNELIFTPIPNLRTKFMYMGGTSGLVSINTDIVFDNTSTPTIKLIDIKLNGKSILPMVKNRRISIPWNHSSFSVKVIVDEQSSFRKHLFKYIISGNDEIVTESYLHTLELGTLPSGKYTISVSCDTPNGEWSQPTDLLTVVVSPPWWKSTWFILLCILFLLCTGGVIFYILIKKRENRLKHKMQEHEKKIYEEKIRFLINISHELRTPLTLIYASLKRVLNQEVTTSEVPEYLHSAYKQTVQMKDTINLVLDARKMEVGQEVLHIASYPLHEWIKEVGDDFQTAMKGKDIVLGYEFDERIEHLAYDATKCRVVLSNLIMNALKYSPNSARITIKTALTDQAVQVLVQDRGIGIDNVDLDKLFTRFYQGKHNHGGSGIGLSYAKMLIEMHGGRVGAINNEDSGATFFYELPINLQEQDLTCPQRSYLNELLNAPEQTKPEAVEFSLRKYSLLVVEDKEDLRDFLKKALKDKFKKIFLAEDGIEAMRVVEKQQPDIILSDVMMPRMNGYELCKTIKERLDISHIPIILLTARADSESQALGYKLGADDYLSKPFELDVLLSVIQNQIRNREHIKLKYKNHSTEPTPQETTFSNADEKFVLKLNALIDSQLSQQNLDVKFLTEELSMSRTSLYSKIKSLTGMGVNDYINRKRIERASTLLLESDMNITEISEAVGFTYQRYFSTLFKEIKGVTPSQFKAQRRA